MSQNQTSDIQPSDAQTMTIGQLSEVTGLSPSAIRFYQRRSLLQEREGAGWQRFDQDALGRLAIIELAKSAGFSLDEIVRFFDALNADPDSIPAETPIWHGLAEVKLVDVELRIRRLQHMHRILQDALNASYLSADRVRQAPSAMGWTPEETADPANLPQHVELPTSTRDLDAVATDHPVAG
jgi:MerR family transcriptional regulator, redox-sensitive transcriptional activator SoxR